MTLLNGISLVSYSPDKKGSPRRNNSAVVLIFVLLLSLFWSRKQLQMYRSRKGLAYLSQWNHIRPGYCWDKGSTMGNFAYRSTAKPIFSINLNGNWKSITQFGAACRHKFVLWLVNSCFSIGSVHLSQSPTHKSQKRGGDPSLPARRC